MALSEHYELRYLDPDEAISDFPSQWDHVIDKIDTAIHDAATAPVSLSRLPNLPTSKVTSGRFADARIPTTVARTSETSALESRIAELESGPRVTGPRNVNSLINNEMHDSGNCFIERHNNIVVMYFSNLNLVGSGSTSLMTIPFGFKPNINPVQSFVSDKRTRSGYLDIYGSGSVWMDRFGDGINHVATVSWVTDDDWPSTLPGDPA